MSYRIEYNIKQLELKIPMKDLPLKSDTIVGTKFPELLLQEDECSMERFPAIIMGDFAVWNEKDFHAIETGSNNIGELEDLCIKYKGTLIMDGNGEGTGDVEYIRIRDGIKKKIKIIEED